eukprot:TRINITY_DN16674_c0_g2_i1.p1 TRINITY_DN16674_c0_g2~~TRINITY_DN16674_c0_g2_i1.p1  ORF type:complete len:1181 (+),score=151.94 TRINITY_DN16674_c0_g2_i1:109-3543(+)
MAPSHRKDTLRVSALPFPRDDVIERGFYESTMKGDTDVFRERPPRQCWRTVSPLLEPQPWDLRASRRSSPPVGFEATHRVSKGVPSETSSSVAAGKVQASQTDEAEDVALVQLVTHEFNLLRNSISDIERRILNHHGLIQASTQAELEHRFPRTEGGIVPTSQVDTPPTEFSVMSNSMDHENLTADSTQDTYAPGDRVSYLSTTARKWIGATVTRHNADGSYDLDVKRRVNSLCISKKPQMLPNFTDSVIGMPDGSARPAQFAAVRTHKQGDNGIYDIGCYEQSPARPLLSKPTLAQIISISGVPSKSPHLGVGGIFEEERNKKSICNSGEKMIAAAAPLKIQMPVRGSQGSSDNVASTSEAVVGGEIASWKLPLRHDIGSCEEPLATLVSSRPSLGKVISISGVPAKPVQFGVASKCEEDFEEQQSCNTSEMVNVSTMRSKMQIPNCVNGDSTDDEIANVFADAVDRHIPSWKPCVRQNVGSCKRSQPRRKSCHMTLAQDTGLITFLGNPMMCSAVEKSEQERGKNKIWSIDENVTEAIEPWKTQTSLWVSNGSSSDDEVASISQVPAKIQIDRWNSSVRHGFGTCKQPAAEPSSSRITLAQAISEAGVPNRPMHIGDVETLETKLDEKQICNIDSRQDGVEQISSDPVHAELFGKCPSKGRHTKMITDPPSRTKLLSFGKERVQERMLLQGCGKDLSSRGRIGPVAALLSSSWWDIFVCVMISVYTVFVGIQVDYATKHVTTNAPAAFYVVGNFFTLFFLLELLLRIWHYGIKFFTKCDGADKWWNYFDLLLVASALVEVVVDIQTLVGTEQGDGTEASSAQLRVLRILRIARLMKVFRVARIIRFIPSLRTLINSIVCTLRSVSCALILMLMIIYVFGMIIVQAVRDHITDNPDSIADLDGLEMYWSTLIICMFTLLKTIVGGISWHECVVPLEDLPLFLIFVFLSYVLFMYFAVMNVITAVFCENAIQSKRNDQEVVMQEQVLDKKKYVKKLKTLFTTIDEDHSGLVSRDELERFLDRELSGAFFEYLELDVNCANDIMKLIDLDGSGELDIDEFVDGICHLRGSARSVDLAELGYHLQTFQQQILRRLGTLEGAVGASNRRADTLAAKGLAAQPDLTSLGDTVELPSQMGYKSSSISDF